MHFVAKCNLCHEKRTTYTKICDNQFFDKVNCKTKRNILSPFLLKSIINR